MSSTREFEVDSRSSLAAALEFAKKNGEFKVVLTVTGCNPLSDAGYLFKVLDRAKSVIRSNTLIIRGLEILEELNDLADLADSSTDVYTSQAMGEARYIPAVYDHAMHFTHDVDMGALEHCMNSMDIRSMWELDADVHAHCALFEHHKYLVQETAEEATSKWIPSVQEEMSRARTNQGGEEEEEEEETDEDSEDESDDEEEDDNATRDPTGHPDQNGGDDDDDSEEED